MSLLFVGNRIITI